MGGQISIELTQERETTLITLYGKAEESRLRDSLLQDHYAAAAIERIDYDFRKLRVTRDGMVSLAFRAKSLDDWTRDFLSRHSFATVLHLGCGLDSRIWRVNPSNQVAWFEVDFPEVIALRGQIFPERPGCESIAASLLDANWVRSVPTDRPTFVIAEGVLPYLPASAVAPLLQSITSHFAQGEIVFDAYSRWGVRMLNYLPAIRATGAQLRWGLDDPLTLEKEVPGLRLLTERPTLGQEQLGRYSWPLRWLTRATCLVPSLQGAGRLLRYRLGDGDRRAEAANYSTK
ncbi:MAG: class I SAM-dependent methyltransferase [Blastopirellula sp. JB062]